MLPLWKFTLPIVKYQPDIKWLVCSAIHIARKIEYRLLANLHDNGGFDVFLE
jgi:hypothetical protein